ncbi:MAG: hypothetical protein GTO51_01230 [Candidatus Latescibacteria bacterium]|nr:hypothetical protein [Candidatus Latescibacterota bacterium]NIM21622.1 hypothetical protein [Candidatus Latescibacterota bacterium]NIM64601.1 hypothetical protein [Candidatus Latescibacterota bacterium]NIO01116.1 hypothetical protein [Candidatus Latescibacterota bacterium]NIO27509.1 hypothetical protein [Candidatus Latescibacterota bacterium]
MFSKQALARLDLRGRSASAYLVYAKECFQESLENMRRHRTIAASLGSFSLGIQATALLALSPLYLPSRGDAYLGLLVVTLLGNAVIVGWLLLHVGLMRDRNDAVVALNLANRLTIVRFVLIPPLLFLMLDNRLWPALIVYILLAGTDIIDGFVARRRNEQTQFGVVMDPLADVFSTAAVFAALMLKNLVPLWVFIVLMLRYGTLIVGTTVLFFAVGPLTFRATTVGKIVGVLQASAVIIIVGVTLAGIDVKTALGKFLFPFLGLIFCFVIISQLVFGIGYVRKRTVKVGS